MKLVLFFLGAISLTSFYFCNSNSYRVYNQPGITKDDAARIANDTICIENDSVFINKSVILLNTCSVLHSDSSSSLLYAQIVSGKLDSQYSFQSNSDNYIRKGDTVILKTVFITSCRGVKVLPRALQLVNDTVIINETLDWSNCTERAKGGTVEEYFCTFIIKEKIKNLVFKKIGNAVFQTKGPFRGPIG